MVATDKMFSDQDTTVTNFESEAMNLPLSVLLNEALRKRGFSYKEALRPRPKVRSHRSELSSG